MSPVGYGAQAQGVMKLSVVYSANESTTGKQKKMSAIASAHLYGLSGMATDRQVTARELGAGYGPPGGAQGGAKYGAPGMGGMPRPPAFPGASQVPRVQHIRPGATMGSLSGHVPQCLMEGQLTFRAFMEARI